MATSPQDFKFAVNFQTPKLDLKGKTDKQRAAMNKALTRGMSNGASRVETKLSQLLDQAMESSTWGPFAPKQWYYRKNGEVAGDGTRNLIDTGKLKKSKKVKTEYLQTKTKTSVTYTSPYAAITHYGGAIRPYGNKNAATVILPARPWIDAVIVGGYSGIESLKADEILNNAISEAWKAQFG